MDFVEKLNTAVRQNNSLLCIGLDPDPAKMPPAVDVFEFNRGIIDATTDLACAYKLNLAFYEAMGSDGLDALKRSVEHVPGNVPVIGDAKRGDIGNTARAYAKAIFDNFNFDATTVSPYLGGDSLEPFLEYGDRGIFILCRTSNAGSADFQSLICSFEGSSRPLYEIVAAKANHWNTRGNVGLVVGATYPEELKTIRDNHPDIPILVPGIGAQGGDLALTIKYGVDAGKKGVLISSSRQIIYASQDKDFADAARQAALTTRNEINRHIAGLTA